MWLLYLVYTMFSRNGFVRYQSHTLMAMAYAMNIWTNPFIENMVYTRNRNHIYIYQTYIWYIFNIYPACIRHMTFISSCWSIFTGFGFQHFAPPDPRPLEILQDPRPDPNDDADFEIPDLDALIQAFLAGLSKESDTGDSSPSQLYLAYITAE